MKNVLGIVKSGLLSKYALDKEFAIKRFEDLVNMKVTNGYVGNSLINEFDSIVYDLVILESKINTVNEILRVKEENSDGSI